MRLIGHVILGLVTLALHKKTNLQTRTSEAVEDEQYLSHVTARARLTRKERVDEWVTELEFEAGDSKKYKIEAI